MKKILIGCLLALLPILGFSQYPQLLQNGEQMGTIRTKINNNFVEAWRIFGLYDGRIISLESATHTHSNMAILSGTTASFTTALNTSISTNTTNIGLLSGRVTALENNPIGQVKVNGAPVTGQIARWHSNDSTLDALDLFYVNNNLGVGVVNPVSKIHVDNGNAIGSYTRYTAGTTTGQTLTDGFTTGIDGNGKAWLIQNEALNMGFMTGGTEKMTIGTSTIDIMTSLHFPNIVPVGQYAYPYLDPNDRVMKWDSSYTLGSKVLNTYLPKTKDLLSDKSKDGEIRWPMVEGNDVKWIYRTKDMKFGQMLSLDQGMIEVLLRKNQDLEIKLEDLEDRISVEAKYREGLEKRLAQMEKELSIVKRRSLKK